MPRPSHLALLLALTIPAAAQQIDDPANLMGERVSPQALADDLTINHGAPALEQLLRKLRTRASMMLIVAHPDDEDSGLLTYESHGQGARVAMLTLTRGEGGQNLMSADFNDALGLIRTQELLAEDRYTGTDQFFGTEVDFGFSKTKEETLRKWTHDRVLYDAVRAVRLYRPLVLASVFIGGVTDGHGHHQVAGQIAQEVFLAAGDPKVFPEMGLPPWAPLRVYARVPFARITPEGMFDYATGKFAPPHFHNYVTGADSTTPPVATVTIHEGDKPNIPAFNGMSYAQWARQGLALQKTQIGPNFRPPTGIRSDAGYTLYGSRGECGTSSCPVLGTASSSLGRVSTDAEDDLFTGIDTSFASLVNLAPSAPKAMWAVLTLIDNQTAEAQRLYDPAHPELTAEPLRRGLKLLDDLIRDTEASPLPQIEKFNLLHELRVKRVQFNNALVLALGVTLEASIPNSPTTVSPPTELGFSISASNDRIDVLRVNLVGGKDSAWREGTVETVGATRGMISTKLFVQSSVPWEPTRPYFYRPTLTSDYYTVKSAALRNAPATPDPIVLSETFRTKGVLCEIQAVVPDPTAIVLRDASSQGATISKSTRLLQPAVIVPAMSLDIEAANALLLPPVPKVKHNPYDEAPPNGAGIVPIGSPSFNLRVALHFKVTRTPELGLAPVSAVTASGWKLGEIQYAPASTDQLATLNFLRDPSARFGTSWIELSAKYENRIYDESVRPVGYPGLTYTNYYTPVVYRATDVDVTTAPNLRVAYLPGTGDDVPQFLPSLGVTPTILAVKDLTPDTLNHYDAVLLGVRAYSAHPDLAGPPSDALTAYAKQGGVVIVQYNSAGFKPESAPFPYTVPGDSAHNVVEEEHPVTILAPDNPLLTWPNRITPADFDHWTEERGHGFAAEWAPEYTPLLEMHDDGQDPQKGGLLVAKVGKGAYIYCALALYRQLPEGVPGAYRLVANLLSYAKNPGR